MGMFRSIDVGSIKKSTPYGYLIIMAGVLSHVSNIRGCMARCMVFFLVFFGVLMYVSSDVDEIYSYSLHTGGAVVIFVAAIIVNP